MVDRIKDKEELRLEALFSSDPVPDLGFSNKVMARVRRQMWVRRLTMPIALLIGGLIAVKPASDLIVAISEVLTVLPANLTRVSVNLPSLPVASLPQMTTIVFVGAIAVIAMIFIPALED